MPKNRNLSPSTPPDGPRKTLFYTRRKGFYLGVEHDADGIYHVIYRNRVSPKTVVKHDFPLAEYADAVGLFQSLNSEPEE